MPAGSGAGAGRGGRTGPGGGGGGGGGGGAHGAQGRQEPGEVGVVLAEQGGLDGGELAPFGLQRLGGEQLERVALAVQGGVAAVAERAVDDAEGHVVADPAGVELAGGAAVGLLDAHPIEKLSGVADQFLEGAGLIGHGQEAHVRRLAPFRNTVNSKMKLSATASHHVTTLAMPMGAG